MGMTETASRIIARFGQTGTFLRRGEQTGGEPWNPTFGPDTEHPATVAVVDYEQGQRSDSAIQADDLRALVSVEGLDITPTVAERLRVGTREFAVVRVTPLAPDGVTRFYDVQVRR